MAAWSRKPLKFFDVLSKNDTLRGNFQNSVPKGFIATPIDVLCSDFVIIGRREVGIACVAYKPYLTKINFAWLSSSRYCADCAQNLPRPASDNVLRVLQISSTSVHFRLSYSQRVNTIKAGREVFPTFDWRRLEPNNKWRDAAVILMKDLNVADHAIWRTLKAVGASLPRQIVRRYWSAEAGDHAGVACNGRYTNWASLIIIIIRKFITRTCSQALRMNRRRYCKIIVYVLEYFLEYNHFCC